MFFPRFNCCSFAFVAFYLPQVYFTYYTTEVFLFNLYTLLNCSFYLNKVPITILQVFFFIFKLTVKSIIIMLFYIKENIVTRNYNIIIHWIVTYFQKNFKVINTLLCGDIRKQKLQHTHSRRQLLHMGELIAHAK